MKDSAEKVAVPDVIGRTEALIPETSYIAKTDFHSLCQVVDSNDATFFREIDPGPSYDVCSRGNHSGTQFAVGDDSGAIRLVSTSTWCVERVIRGTCEVSDIVVSSDSKYLVAVCRPTHHGPFKVVLWDLEKLIMLGDMKHESGVSSWTLPIDEREVYTYDHNLRWLGKVGSAEHRLYQKAQRLRMGDNLQVEQDDRILPSYRNSWIHFRNGLSHRSFMPEQGRSLSHNGKWLAIAQPDGAIVLDVARGSDVNELPSGLASPGEQFFGGKPVATSVWEDGRLVAVGHSMIQDIDIILFDFALKRVTPGYRIRGGDTYDSLAFHPMNTYLAVGDAYQSMIQLVDLRRKRRNRVIEAHAGAIRSLEFCPKGSHLISASKDGQIILWDAETFERQSTLMDFLQPEDLDQPFQWIAYNSTGMVNGSPAVEQLFV